MAVRGARNAMRLMPGGVVSMICRAMTTGETKKRHRRHAGGAEHDAEYVKVHLYFRSPDKYNPPDRTARMQNIPGRIVTRMLQDLPLLRTQPASWADRTGFNSARKRGTI